MHDFDRTQHEYGAPMQEYGEMGFESTYGETPLGEIFQEAGEGSYESYESGMSGELNEEEVMELAAELLEITNEYEMQQFLGGLFSKVGKLAGGIGKAVAPQLSGILKGVLSQALPLLKQAAGAALPVLGGAVGTAFGGPVGGMLGSKLAGSLGGMFGLELEGLSHEDREFEIAKQVVKFAESAVKQAAPQTGMSVQDAVTAAASQFMPGLLRPKDPAAGKGLGGIMNSMTAQAAFQAAQQAALQAAQQGARQAPAPAPGACHHHHRGKGTWVRMGQRIVLYGI